jgi:hypothetical protein
MTTIAQTDCCTMLGIDPKTLRNWLRQANMPFTAHPTDARLKCLTQGQVQQLAALHDRPLSFLDRPHPPRRSTKETPPPQAQENEALLHSPFCTPQADLGQVLLRLQAHVLTLQEQLNQLALELLREREQQRLSMLEALLKPLVEALLKPLVGPPPSPQALAETTGTDLPASKPRPKHRPLSDKPRASSRVLPLIAYTAAGTYIVICPQRGELSLTPDSPQWFDWLATLNSFRFLGQRGRLSTYLNQRRSCWTAYRRIHGHRYDYGLGNTKHLTIDALEQMAATLQSHVPSL